MISNISLNSFPFNTHNVLSLPPSNRKSPLISLVNVLIVFRISFSITDHCFLFNDFQLITNPSFFFAIFIHIYIVYTLVFFIFYDFFVLLWKDWLSFTLARKTGYINDAIIGWKNLCTLDVRYSLQIKIRTTQRWQ